MFCSFLCFAYSKYEQLQSPALMYNPLTEDKIITNCFFYDTGSSINIVTDSTHHSIIISYNSFYSCNNMTKDQKAVSIIGNFYLQIAFNCFHNCTFEQGCITYDTIFDPLSTTILDTNTFNSNGGLRHTVYINKLKNMSQNTFQYNNFTASHTTDVFGIVFIEASEIVEKFNTYAKCINKLCILAHASTISDNEGLVCINNTVEGSSAPGAVFLKCFDHYLWAGAFITNLNSAYFYGNTLGNQVYIFYVTPRYTIHARENASDAKRNLLYITNCYADIFSYNATQTEYQIFSGSASIGLIQEDIPVYNVDSTINCNLERPDEPTPRTPASTPEPTNEPTLEPTSKLTSGPTPELTPKLTPEPTYKPSPEPTLKSTFGPTLEPTTKLVEEQETDISTNENTDSTETTDKSDENSNESDKNKLITWIIVIIATLVVVGILIFIVISCRRRDGDSSESTAPIEYH
jgi:hypothetical protein